MIGKHITPNNNSPERTSMTSANVTGLNGDWRCDNFNAFQSLYVTLEMPPCLAMPFTGPCKPFDDGFSVIRAT